MIKIDVRDETAPLEVVVLGIADSSGGIPAIADAYDPKSIEHIRAGSYPLEEDMVEEMKAVETVFKKYRIEVIRPRIITNCNQLFTRDIAFVVDQYLFISNILPHREAELAALDNIILQIDPEQVVRPPKDVHVEGGDVMLWKDHLFIGTYKGPDYPGHITARTNLQAVAFLKEFFPDKKVKEFDLVKSNTNARENALHLDCCFQPVGQDKGIIHPEGFWDQKDYHYLLELFGKENLFHIGKEEMYEMYSNVFSIAPEVVVSEKSFTRLNNWLREQGFTVEEVPYKEISKQEGLLRCSTLPLRRSYE